MGLESKEPLSSAYKQLLAWEEGLLGDGQLNTTVSVKKNKTVGENESYKFKMNKANPVKQQSQT